MKMKKKAVSGIVVALFLFSVLGIAFNSTAVKGQEGYGVFVQAGMDLVYPLAVDIDWKNTTAQGTENTDHYTGFLLTGQSGELNLTAPQTWTEDYIFYVFDCWYIENDTYPSGYLFPSGQNKVALSIAGETWAVACYIEVLGVDKELTDAFLTPGHIPVDPDEVPLGTKVYFNMTITVYAFEDVTDVVVKDGIGADLVLYGDYDPTVSYAKAGKSKTGMGATIVTWMIGPIAGGADMTLELDVYTGLNSPSNGKKHAPQYQEYTSLGDHDLNSGPVVYFTYDGKQYMLQGPPVTVTVVEVAD